MTSRTLVMTVGTGDVNRTEDTLLTPLRKSIATDAWQAVVLLPSTLTEEYANRVREALGSTRVDIRPLPQDDENDADRAYAHFDQVLADLLRHASPGQIEVDFTRGTKAMSAALVLAATRHAIPQLRYIVGSRDRRGMVEPGSEEVRRIGTSAVDAHRRIDLARALLIRGDFSAVSEVLSDEPRFEGPAPAHAVRDVARFYAAWDRLDYRSAAAVETSDPPSGDWARLWPTTKMLDWVTDLRREPERSNHPKMAAFLRRLIADLLANGERRIRDGHHEDALVRAYRTLELIGQARLFDHGLDSENLDLNHDAVTSLQARLQKKNDTPLPPSRHGGLMAARAQVARLLKRCGDPLAERLLGLADHGGLKPTLRNTSVLIHGFAAKAPADPEPLGHLFEDLQNLARDDGGEPFADRLRIARSPAFDPM